MAAATSQERLAFGFTVLRGYKVEAQVTSGIVYEGIFITANYDQNTPPDKHGIVLKYARVIRDPSVSADKDAPAEKPSKTKIILASDLVHLLAKDVRMSPEDLSGQHEDLETDAAISRGRGGTFGRELQPWMPEAGDTGPSLSLDDSTGGWDQFAVNKEKFGVTTTYNETLYTTVLNKENCAISEEAAQRIAKEIEAGAYATIGLAAYHMAEERGMDVDDGDMNEEDRYGAVVRELPLEPTTRRGSRGSGAGSGPHALPGPHAMNNHNNNAPPPPPPRAWGGLGAGVAVVAGARPGVGPAGPLSGGANGDASHQGSGSVPAAAAPAPSGAQSGSWRSVAAPAANGEDSGRLPHGKGPRMPPSNSLPIRGGQKPNNLSDRHAGLDALSLAVPGPSSTPPELRANFGRWKAQQVEDKKNQERQNTLNELRGIAAAPTPAFTTRHNFHNTHGLATAQPLGTNHQLVPPPANNHLPQPATAPNHAPQSATAPNHVTPAVVPTQAAPAVTATATPAPAATPAAAPPAATPAAPPKKSGLNPNAKEFTLNIGAKPFVPGGAAAPAPSAPPAAAATAPLAPVTSTVLGFKQPLQAGGFVHQGPHALPVHTPMGMHNSMPHAMVHGDGHHGGHSAHVHHGMSNTMQQPSDIVQSLMHAQHAQQGMRMGGLQGGLPGSSGADHIGMSAGGGPHGMPVAMGGSSMGPAGLQGINPANGLPFVALTPGGPFGPMAQVGPSGQPMQLSPGAMMGPHGMMGGSQVMFTGPPQGAHVRPGGLPAGAPQPVALMPVGMPAGGMQQHNGFNYMQGGPQYAMLPMPGNAPITSTMHPNMAAMQLQGGPSMGQGQGHVGNQGADMHMRSQGQGLMKGMMGGGRGGGRGGRGMDGHGHGHMGMQHMGHMGGGHMMPHMVMQVTHDGPKPQQPPPPPPPHDAHHA